MSEPLAVGAKAPDFTLPSHTGEKFTLSDYLGDEGRSVVLFFYPLDWTPV